MQPVTLGRMTVQKVLEMESAPPMPLILQGITPKTSRASPRGTGTRPWVRPPSSPPS